MGFDRIGNADQTAGRVAQVIFRADAHHAHFDDRRILRIPVGHDQRTPVGRDAHRHVVAGYQRTHRLERQRGPDTEHVVVGALRGIVRAITAVRRCVDKHVFTGLGRIGLEDSTDFLIRRLRRRHAQCRKQPQPACRPFHVCKPPADQWKCVTGLQAPGALALNSSITLPL